MKWKKWPIETIKKTDFPEQLKNIRNCPDKLYYRGEWNEKLFKKALTIVGSRRMSRYGREIVEKFMPEFISNSLTIISGFMYGVDTESHRKCLELGGKTVAVLGGGLDVLTPAENDDLYDQILASGGAVVTEYENDFKPTLWSFPQRDRIVAGLTNVGVLVVEAGMKSGSLITARYGREQGKNVWAVPGPITSSVSAGTNYLIEENLAKMATTATTITQKKTTIIQENIFDDNLPSDQKKIMEILKVEPMTIDEISRQIKKNVSEIGLTISLMSLNDLVAEENGKVYLKNSRE
jgi:DNA processing protein